MLMVFNVFLTNEEKEEILLNGSEQNKKLTRIACELEENKEDCEHGLFFPPYVSEEGYLVIPRIGESVGFSNSGGDNEYPFPITDIPVGTGYVVGDVHYNYRDGLLESVVLFLYIDKPEEDEN